MPVGAPARAAGDWLPSVRIGDAVVLKPYVLSQYDAATTFAHSRGGGPGAGSNLRRLRLGVEAEVLRDVEAVFIWDFGGSPGSRSRLYQASLAYKGLGPFTLTGGVFKQQFSLEEMQSSGDTLFLERAAVVTAAAGLAAESSRVGVQAKAHGERWLVSAALTGGKTGPGSDSGQRGAAARVAGLPVQSGMKSGNLTVNLGLSGAVSWRPPREDGETVVALSERPELAVDRWSSPLDTGAIKARRARTGGVEAGLGLGRFWAQAEAYGIEVDRAEPQGGTLGFTGYYAQASYTVLGKPREWDSGTAAWGAPKPAERRFDPAAGQWGALEVGARVSELDLSDADVRGGRQRVWTAGVNWWPIEPVRVSLQYQNTTIKATDEDRRFQAVALRGQIKF